MNVTPTDGEKHVLTWTWEIRTVVSAMTGNLTDVARASESRGGKHYKDILDVVEDFVAMYHTKSQNNWQGSCNATAATVLRNGDRTGRCTDVDQTSRHSQPKNDGTVHRATFLHVSHAFERSEPVEEGHDPV